MDFFVFTGSTCLSSNSCILLLLHWKATNDKMPDSILFPTEARQWNFGEWKPASGPFAVAGAIYSDSVVLHWFLQ